MNSILRTGFVLFSLFFISSSSIAFVALPSQPFVEKGHNPENVSPSPFANMTVNDFLLLTPKKYRVLTGKKLSLSQKVTLKLAQYQVQRLIRKNRNIDLLAMTREIDTNNFDILGFILGVALGPLGVLIAYLIEGKGSSTFTWSIIGALIWLGVFLLVVLIL